MIEAPDREEVLRRSEMDTEELVRGMPPSVVTEVLVDEFVAFDGVRRFVLTTCW